MFLEQVIARSVIDAAAQNCVKIVTKKAPLILMGVGIGGMGASTVMAVQATPKANAIYKQIIRTPNLPPNERNKEIFKRVVPLYAPAALAFVTGATCVVGSYSINMARLAELGAAYALTQNQLTTYRKEIEKKYGKDEEEALTNKVRISEGERQEEARQVDNFAKKESKRLLPPDGPKVKLFYDKNTQRPVYTTEDDIWNACADIEHRLGCGETFICYQELESDLNCVPANFSSSKGWMAGDIVRPWFSDEYVTSDGNKYREFEIDTNPRFAEAQRLGDM